MKINNELEPEYVKMVTKLTEITLECLCLNMPEQEKYTTSNITLNVLTNCLMRVMYLTIPAWNREMGIQMVVDQLRENFKENDKINMQEILKGRLNGKQ